MNTVFVVSPNYLECILLEAKKYSFYLQGYGNSTSAAKGLLRVNAKDILGLAYVADRLPIYGTSEYKSLMKLVQLCDLLGINKRFIFVTVGNMTNLSGFTKGHRNLKFSYLSEIGYVSDITINRDIFGTILLDNFEPYLLHEDAKTKGEVHKFEIPCLNYSPIVNSYLIQCLEPVNKYAGLDIIVSEDKIYNKFINSNKPLANLRLAKIYKAFQKDITELKEEICKDTRTFEPSVFCIYQSLIYMIERGVDFNV